MPRTVYLVRTAINIPTYTSRTSRQSQTQTQTQTQETIKVFSTLYAANKEALLIAQKVQIDAGEEDTMYAQELQQMKPSRTKPFCESIVCGKEEHATVQVSAEQVKGPDVDNGEEDEDSVIDEVEELDEFQSSPSREADDTEFELEEDEGDVSSDVEMTNRPIRRGIRA